MKKKILKNCLIIYAVYAALILVLYFLMGEQLHIRESRGNVKMPEQNFSLVEINKDVTAEQNFSVKIQQLRQISVRWSALSRVNSGTIRIVINRLDNGEKIGEQIFNASDIIDGAVTQINFDPPIKSIYDIPLRLTVSSDSDVGMGTAVMLGESKENYTLFINGEGIEGAICCGFSGNDEVWTGKHYWKFALIGAVIIAVVMIIVLIKVEHGKRSYILNAIHALKKYQFLISQLVSRDFKTKYKRSFFGVLWSFFNPLLTSLVMYVVFSNIFRANVDHYPVYLISGSVMFNFFSECCGMCLGSIVGNAPLITKVYVPKYVYPLTRTLSSGINLGLAFIPVIIIALINGVFPTKAWLLVLFPLVCFMIFCFGFGLILSTSMVFFRDTQFLWSVVSMMWMYITPIFYSIDILSPQMLTVLKFNPVYYYIDYVRTCIIGGVSPEPVMYAKCFLIAVAFLIFGSVIFKKNQDKFVLYL